ncbi:MAG: histidinol-phosphatase HisJ family protein [Ruminococcaceae bacterium]|nr:histidinol-phosphatase HisJ family protein [Oscillospiraceae bacterium]
MMNRDLHTHTIYSDGKNSPEEMVLSAIEKGLKVIGISDHSYTGFDSGYCIKAEKIEDYIKEIQRLKIKYRDKIEVLCGLEQDLYSDKPKYNFDYIIGSVHYIKIGEEYVPVDFSAQKLKAAADKYFDGNIYPLIEEYYRLVGTVAEKTGADIIGHFDLITKFQEKEPLFDEKNERYIRAWQAAVDKLIEANIPFEINSGAISRGYRTTPYPSKDIMDYIIKKGGRFIYSSDSHNKDSIANFKEL